MKIASMNEEQRDLASKNVGLVHYAVNKYLKSLKFDYDDMISIGYLGLCNAAIMFDPSKDKAFSTYAVRTIINTIRREAQYIMRKKRGGGKRDVSLDHCFLEADREYGDSERTFSNSLFDVDVDIENEALNRIICKDIWKMVPTYCAIENSGMNGREYSYSIGKSRSYAYMNRRIELKRAKKYLVSHGIYSST